MKIIEYSVKNPVFANLLMATIIIFGLYIGFGLPKELFPSIGFEKVTDVINLNCDLNDAVHYNRIQYSTVEYRKQ